MPVSVTPQDSLTSLLMFYQDSGVDAVIGEAAVDRFVQQPPGIPSVMSQPRAQSPRAAPAALPEASTAPPAPRIGIAIAADAAIDEARQRAATAHDLDSLRQTLLSFDGCALKTTATQIVFSGGDPRARVMVVGDVPSRDDDLSGRPFAGQAGMLLVKALAGIRIDLASIYSAHLIPWRPPGNREPTAHEIALCLPFIQRHIALIKPDYLICLGEKTAQTLLNSRDGIMKARGRWMPLTIDDHPMQVLPMLSPDYCLRSPLAKKLMWQDVILLKKALNEQAKD